MLITSTGFAKTLDWLRLGKYIEDGTSNGYISYKNADGSYLHFGTGGEWIVSKLQLTNGKVCKMSRDLYFITYTGHLKSLNVHSSHSYIDFFFRYHLRMKKEQTEDG